MPGSNNNLVARKAQSSATELAASSPANILSHPESSNINESPQPMAYEGTASNDLVQSPGASTSKSPSILNQPPEIMKHILDFLIGDEIVVTTSPFHRIVSKSGDLVHSFPQQLKDLNSLLTAYPSLEASVDDYLSTSVTFTNNYGDTSHILSDLLGPTMCSQIRRFDLCFQHRLKALDQRFWPKTLAFIVQNLPNLRWLRICTTPTQISVRGFNLDRRIAETLVKVKEEILNDVVLCRFAAFIVHMHPNLDIMYRPVPFKSAKYPWAYVIQKQQSRKWEQSRKSGGPDKNGDTDSPDGSTAEDKIINAAAIRELTWAEMCELEIDDFVLHPEPGQSLNDIATSDIATEEHRQYYGEVDRLGYRLRAIDENTKLRAKEATHVDSMIKRARRQRARDTDIDVASLVAGFDDLSTWALSEDRT